MADGVPGDAERPPQFKEIGVQVAAGLREGAIWNDAGGVIGNAVTVAVTEIIAFLIKMATPIAAGLAQGIARGEDRTEGAFGELAAVAISDALGVNVSAGAWTGRGGRGGRTASVQQMTSAALGALVPLETTTLQPATEPTTRFMSYVLQMGLEGWLEGWIFEMLTSIPYFPGVETFAELDDILARVFGLERLSRRVLGPYVDALIVTPAEWHVNKTYRPRLLTPAEGVRQFTRGRWSREALNEELARQGYSDDRIEALIASTKRRLSVSQVLDAIQTELFSEEVGRQLLMEDGFDETTAALLITVDRTQRIDAFNKRFADAAVAAFASGAITEGELDASLQLAFRDVRERQAYRDLARFQRQVRARDLSESQLEAAVKRNIIPISEYRSGLRRIGFTEEAIGVLELLLRDELNDRAEAERLKRERDERLAAEREAKRLADLERKRQIEAERAVTEPSLAQFERAVVRGLVSVAAYGEFLAAEKYAPDVIAFLVGLVEQARAAYVADLERRAAAEARAARSQLAIGQLERAVERGILSPGEYRAQLVDRALPAGDVELLVRLAEDLRAARVDADARRAAAEARAQQRGISLAQLERAVLRGVRSLADYQAELAALGFDGADQATLVELLRVELGDRAAADARRQEAATRAAQRGISLAQLERAVLRGVRSLADYQQQLVALGFPAADVSTLVDLLRVELEEAQRARERRAQLDRDQPAVALSLATIQRAVAAGVLTIADYRAVLARRGFADADQDVLVSLAILDLQEAAAARERRAAIEAERTTRTLSLGQAERAVRAGAATIADYRAVLAREGFADADRGILVELLELELASDAAARARRAEIEQERSERTVSLSQGERAVRAGVLTLAGYRDLVAAAGYDEADQALLVATLAAQLAAEAARRAAPEA
jgi:hypothetical protein